MACYLLKIRRHQSVTIQRRKEVGTRRAGEDHTRVICDVGRFNLQDTYGLGRFVVERHLHFGKEAIEREHKGHIVVDGVRLLIGHRDAAAAVARDQVETIVFAGDHHIVDIAILFSIKLEFGKGLAHLERYRQHWFVTIHFINAMYFKGFHLTTFHLLIELQIGKTIERVLTRLGTDGCHLMSFEIVAIFVYYMVNMFDRSVFTHHDVGITDEVSASTILGGIVAFGGIAAHLRNGGRCIVCLRLQEIGGDHIAAAEGEGQGDALLLRPCLVDVRRTGAEEREKTEYEKWNITCHIDRDWCPAGGRWFELIEMLRGRVAGGSN